MIRREFQSCHRKNYKCGVTKITLFEFFLGQELNSWLLWRLNERLSNWLSFSCFLSTSLLSNIKNRSASSAFLLVGKVLLGSTYISISLTRICFQRLVWSETKASTHRTHILPCCGPIFQSLDKFINLGSSVSSTEKDIDTRLTKAWTAIEWQATIWKSDLTDKIKRSSFQAVVVSILLYVCTTWALTKRLEKKLDGNYTRMLRAILNKSWRQHPTKHQLYGHLPSITKTIQARRPRHAEHCWRSRDELISDVLLWTPTYGRAKAGRPDRTYIQQLREDTGCSPEDQPEAMNDWEKWRARVRDIRASGMTWWWWW